ncbi:hypothetical protein [Laspinema olomoucense]|uniref:hypothetical protein n=1 Tax=Laspinema olomoucense TaxID=3231600 RepID=UPI0021BA54F2|nr:hypothetical protein [Laspinema sp. D3d]MCT7971215.1 hypothetical protein [Laspinema sp. D3d]
MKLKGFTVFSGWVHSLDAAQHHSSLLAIASNETLNPSGIIHKSLRYFKTDSLNNRSKRTPHGQGDCLPVDSSLVTPSKAIG